jgi:hypothetical protein
MEIIQGIFLYSYLYLKLAKTSCFSYYLLCIFFYNTRVQRGGEGVGEGGAGGGGERGRRMNMVQIMYIHICKCKSDKKRLGKTYLGRRRLSGAVSIPYFYTPNPLNIFQSTIFTIT